MSRATERIVLKGPVRTIAYAQLAEGSMLARDFIMGCRKADQRKLLRLFERMALHGEVRGGEKFHQLEGPIWEFKSYQIRIPCFREGKEWVLTHGFVKKADWGRKFDGEIRRALRIRDEDLNRRRKS